MAAIDFRAIAETGCYRGTTAEYLAEATKLPVYSVEPAPRFFGYSQMRLWRHKNARLRCADSRAFLRELAGDARFPKQLVFFYLDAHWEEDLPLADELGIISAAFRDVVIMVDDFEVPSDSGYTFDDYGKGKRLCLDYLGDLQAKSLQPFFPTAPASKETGMKRGCVVLVSDGLADGVARLPSLRRAAV